MSFRFIIMLAAGVMAWAVPAKSGAAGPVTPEAVAAHYADMAEAMYADARDAAADLQAAVDRFLAQPSAASLASARQAWIEARVWYQRTEGFRFGNPAVDALEPRVNSWPLDEGLIDYVDPGTYGAESEENELYTANVIANPLLRVGDRMIDSTVITPEVIVALNEAAGSETNVSMGYHAIEFLLWGQDLNGTGPGAGNRPYTDYDAARCSHGACDRRAAYLAAATRLLVSDLGGLAALWEAKGAARTEYLARPKAEALAVILTGLGSLSYGELAGERMKLSLILHDPEEEQDCFSDNTHNSHFNDVEGMWAIYSGTVARRDGATLDGPGIQDLAAAAAPERQKALDALMQNSRATFKALKDKADSGAMAYDQMIAAGNAEGNALVQAGVDALIAQTRGIEALVSALKLEAKVEGSDSLDSPASAQ